MSEEVDHNFERVLVSAKIGVDVGVGIGPTHTNTYTVGVSMCVSMI